MNLEQIITQENQQRKQEELNYKVKIEQPSENILSKPRVKQEPLVVQQIREQEQKDREARDRLGQGFETETGVETPASIYHEIHGESMLRNVLSISFENEKTEFINGYVLEKMRVGKMEDTKANFEKVLNRLFARNNLAINQQKPYLINKLYLYLKNGIVDEDDNIILSILGKRGAKYGIRR